MPYPDRNSPGPALLSLAISVTAVAGFVDATGFLSFGRLFLASPDANAIVAAVGVSGNGRLALYAGAAVLAFLAGVVLTSLATARLARFRRSAILLVTGALLCSGFLILEVAGAHAAAALLCAMAMGAIHCVDGKQLQRALLPSVQLARFGEALARGHIGGAWFPALLWLMFLGGGILGAGLWFMLGVRSLVLAAGLVLAWAAVTWLIERGLRPENPSDTDGA
jgi:uncharacterized membrane protein YoaK (UPF0700 family)